MAVYWYFGSNIFRVCFGSTHTNNTMTSLIMCHLKRKVNKARMNFLLISILLLSHSHLPVFALRFLCLSGIFGLRCDYRAYPLLLFLMLTSTKMRAKTKESKRETEFWMIARVENRVMRQEVGFISLQTPN